MKKERSKVSSRGVISAGIDVIFGLWTALGGVCVEVFIYWIHVKTIGHSSFSQHSDGLFNPSLSVVIGEPV